MGLLENLLPKAQIAHRTLVLPDGHDPRVMEAAARIAKRGIARVIVLATPEEREISAVGISFDGLGVSILDHLSSPDLTRLANRYYELRAAKGKTPEAAENAVRNRIYFGNMMVREGMADGLIAGSMTSMPETLRAAFKCVGPAPGIRSVSSCFVMELAKPTAAGDKILIFADSSVIPNPNSEQLTDIAIAAIRSHKSIVGGQQRVAFLSFSTKGSAHHEMVDKMTKATELTRQRVRELKIDAIIDGELQADSALVPMIAANKCPNSPIKGSANILIFPDLNSGNIAYKLTERLAGATAYGPVMQGLAKPINEVSRGCSIDDIVGVAAITVCQSLA